MNIIQIIPGSGGSFYCGNCLRDSKFYDAMRNASHNVIKISMYFPLFADEHDLGEVPVFYGAISMYLKQQFPWLKNMPRQVERLLNSKPMLKLSASQAGSTRATGLEDMTISMLLGVDPEAFSGRFRFVTGTEDLDTENPWLSLQQNSGDVIPAIADQTVIQWGLGKKVGNTLVYIDAFGEKRLIQLIGGLGASIFQGSLIISTDNFLQLYPYSSGSNVFLVDGAREKTEQIQQTFDEQYKRYGIQMHNTASG